MVLARLARSKSLRHKPVEKKYMRGSRRASLESLENREMMAIMPMSYVYGPAETGYATPQPIMRPTGSVLRYVPNDDYYNRYQWQMKDYDLPSGIAKGANVEQAWDFVLAQDNGDPNDPDSFGLGDGVLIAFNDDGVQLDHPELIENARQFNFGSCDWTINPIICSPTGGVETDPFVDIHGTAVAGIAVASRDNNQGISGVAPDAHWLSSKILPTFPLGARGDDLMEADGLTAHNPFCGALPIGPMTTRLGQQFFSQIDIFNNSWGPVDGVDWRTPASIPGPQAQGAIDCGIARGRDGKGAIYVWAAGNGGAFGDNINFDQYANSRKVISVGAIDANGQKAVYSEPGASLFVVAPSSGSFNGTGGTIPPQILTTDVVSTEEGRDLPTEGDTGGYNYHTGANDPRGNPPYPPDGDTFEDLTDPTAGLGYTSFGHYAATDAQGGLGGTSAAAPVVSGIIALMLDVNPNLTWRDVQQILVRSTYQNDGADSDWATNKAGFKVNHKYGFGAIDAQLAVTTAANWPGVGAQQVFKTGPMNVLRAPTDPAGTIGRVIPDNGGPVAALFDFATDCFDTVKNLDCTLNDNPLPDGYDGSTFPNLEWIEVVLTTDHEFAGDLEVTLYAPDASGQPGQFRSILATKNNSGENYDQWVFTTNRDWGELPKGKWRLEIKDTRTGNVGNFISWEMNFYGGSVPPIALNDNVTASSGIGKLINVLQNDTGAYVSNTVQIVTPPAVGTAVPRADGKVIYTSPPGFVGTVTFQYRVSDQFGQPSNIATVTVRVIPFNPPPTAVDDTATTSSGVPVTINLLANDFDPPPTTGLDTSSVSIFLAPPSAVGTVSAPINGMVTFTPKPTFTGEAQFRYTVKDLSGQTSNTAIVRITVGASPPALPVANNDFATVNEGNTVSIDVLANDTVASGAPQIDRSTVQITLLPQNGAIGIPDPITGVVKYTPNADFGETDTFQYFVRDTQGRPSAVATVTISVNAIPFAANDSVTITEETIGMINVLANDSDEDSNGSLNPNTVSILAPPSLGTATVTPGSGIVRYVPTCDATGFDSFTYTVKDNEGLSSNAATVSVLITQANDAPRANDDVAGTNVGQAVTISPWANDTDADPADSIDPNSIVVPFGGGPKNGTLVFNDAANTYTYTPNAGFSGGDSFIYFVKDTSGMTSNQGTVRIRVGASVSISGYVYADIKSPFGTKNADELGIPGAEVVATVTNGAYTHTQSVRTDANGFYQFVDNPTDPLHPIIMPPGTYTIKEIQPGFFGDGIDTAGTPAPGPGLPESDIFKNIVLGPGQSATNYLFGESGVKGQFVVSHLANAQYFASASFDDGVNDTDPFVSPRPANTNLSNGNVWFSFDRGLSGRYFVEAVSSDGVVALTAYKNDLVTVAASSGAAKTFARIEFDGRAIPDTQFLRVSGTGTNYTLRVGKVDQCIVTTPPASGEVLVKSSTWAQPFLDNLILTNQGVGGYRLPVNDLSQFEPLPFAGLDRIMIRFSEAVGVGQASLKVTGSNHGVYAINGFNYEPITNTATWNLAAPLDNDRILLDLNSPNGNVDLRSLTEDGEFYRFSVLPGDVNRNATVNLGDIIEVNNRIGQAIGGASYSVYHDLNGSGTITTADRNIAIANMFHSIPIAEVPLPASSPSAPDAIVAGTTARTGALAARLVERQRHSAADSALEALTAPTSNESAKLRARRTLRPAVLSIDELFSQ
jgi:subtilisin-like proprotein convertase family protein